MTAVGPHLAIGGPMLVSGNLLVIVAGYLGILVILVVFGIWGFRLGSKGSDGNPGGGGPKRPEPVTPPRGGRELDGQGEPADLDVFDPAGLMEHVPEPAPDLVAPGSRR